MSIHTKSADQNINPTGGNNETEFASTRRVTKSDSIVFGDDGTDFSLGTFPSGALIVGVSVATTTAFDSGTSDTLDVGTTSGGQELVAAGDIQAAGLHDLTLVATACYFSSDTEVFAEYNSAGTAPTAGACVVNVEWIAPEPS